MRQYVGAVSVIASTLPDISPQRSTSAASGNLPSMRSSFIYRWSQHTGCIMIDLTKKCTAYIGKLSKLPTPNINLCLLNLRRPISPVPGTRRATHEYRTRRPALNSFESCLSEPAAIAISIGYENKCHSLSILAHSINMALCKDSFTGNMRTFNYDESPFSWEDYLARTSHVWSPEFSALLRKKGRKMARGEEGSGWFGLRSYRGWTEVIVWNLLDFFGDADSVRHGEGLEGFEPLFQVETLVER